MRQNQLAIHSENILPIIKKWLYSDKDIFIRELVSNATDALNKVRILTEQGKAEESECKISITIDKSLKTLTIADTGIGMTEEEVERYIAQIAFSGAEEFVAKYSKQAEKDPIIGHFGLGFYSAYMVASNVEIDTLSYLPDAKPVYWSCDGTSSYSIGEGKRSQRGTTITLHLNEQNLEYLEEAALRELLRRYCNFMPFPIELEGKPLGNQPPLWMKSPAECTDQEYIAFHRQLFPLEPDPLFWVHLNVDYPFHLKGILYFPKMHRRFDANKSTIQLYCNRVFVSDNCKDILPDYLMILRGAIDSPDIPLNVSRSYLQVDKNVRQLSSHIAKKVADRLSTLHKSDRDRFLACWADVETIIKLGILQDAKFFEKVKDLLIWKNSEGSWTNVSDYLERAPISEKSEKKVYYAAAESTASLLQLYKEKKVEILFTSSPLDAAVIHFLEEKLGVPFQRIDGAVGEHLLDPSREKSLLDAEGKTEAARIADFIRTSLNEKELQVEAKSFASDALPALLIFDEKERRMRDYLTLTQGKEGASLPTKKTFVVNTNHKLIQALVRLQQKEPKLAQEMAQGIYDLSQISQRELPSTDVEKFVSRQAGVLERLAIALANPH